MGKNHAKLESYSVEYFHGSPSPTPEITWIKPSEGVTCLRRRLSKPSSDLDECGGPGKWSVVFEKFTSAYFFQIAQEKSFDYLLIIYTKNITTTTNFDSAHIFSSFNWLAETDYYLCQIQTFSRPTLSKSFS